MWNEFNYKFADRNKAFEDLCREFLNIKLNDNPLTPFNKAGSETESYHGKYSFQSKYCETPRLANNKKGEIIEGILREKQNNDKLEEFYIFVYPQFTDKSNAKKDITKAAQNVGVICKFYDKNSLMFELRENTNYYRLITQYFQNEKDWRATHLQPNLSIPVDYIERRILLNSEKDKADSEINIEELIEMHCNILIINHAGYGKTVYLKNLFNKHNTSTNFGTAFISLKNYRNNSLITFLRSITDPKAYIFMDGYDEIDSNLMDDFKKEVSQMLEIHCGWRFIITSRYNPSIIGNEFKICELLPFNDEDICRYLNKNEIEITDFITNCKINKIDMFLYNSFYLSQIVSYYKKTGLLPIKNNLLKQLFENQFASDKVKIESSEMELLLDKLAKISFDYMSGKVDKIIINDKDRNFGWLYYDVNDSVLDFIHNNFKEYLAAVHLNTLSKDEIIKLTAITFGEYVVVIPKFRNVLAHLFDISEIAEVKDFIKEKAMYLILKSDYILENDKNVIEIVKTIFKEVNDKKSWISENYDINNISKICNKECVEYLISLLSFNNHRTVVIESLNVLRRVNFEHLSKYNLKEKIFAILQEKEKCINDSYLTDVLIRTLCVFELTKEEVKFITDNYFLINSSIRVSIYDLILSTNNCDNFANLLIEGIKLNRAHATFNSDEENDDNAYNISEGYFLYNCIEKLRLESSIIALLDKLEESIKNHRFLGESFEKSLFIALSESEITKDIKNKLFEIYIINYKHYNKFDYKNVFPFIEKKNFSMELFDCILKSDLSKNQQICAISSFITQQIMRELMGIFRVDKTYWDCYYYLETLLDDEYKRINIFHKIVTDHELNLPDKIDRTQIRNDKIQDVFNLLFDISKMREYCESEILKFKANGGEFIDYYYENNQPPLLKSLYHIQEDLDVNKINWNSFQVNKIYNYIKNYSFLSIDDEKISFIKQWIIDNYSTIKFQDNVKIKGNGYTFTYYGQYANYFIKRFDLQFDELVYSDMLYHDILLCSEGELSYVKNKISEELFKKTCLDILMNHLVEGTFCYNFMINYCLNNRWYEISELLTTRLDNINNFSEIDYDEKRNFLQYIELSSENLLSKYWCKFDTETKILYFSNLSNITGENQELLINEINNNTDNVEKFIELGVLNSINIAREKCIEIIEKNGFDNFNIETFGKLKCFDDYEFLIKILELSYSFKTKSFRDLKSLIFDSIECIINELLKKKEIEKISEILTAIQTFIKESGLPNVGYLYYFINRILGNISFYLEKQI